MKRPTLLIAITGVVLGAITGCAPRRAVSRSAPESLVLGRFEDDYGIRYEITERLWHQLPRARYHVVRWSVAEGYLVARNDSANTSAAGRWTRIDWIRLEGMAPWEWAFCLSAYDAPDLETAAATRIADRTTPRTGCNGFPFSRMKRTP